MYPRDSVLHYFLAERCDEAFLRAFVEARPEIWQGLLRLHLPMADSNNIRLLARFKEIGLLSEENVETLVKEIRENTLEWFDASIFQDRRVGSLLPADEFERLCADVRSEWFADLDASVDRMRGSYSSSEQAGMYECTVIFAILSRLPPSIFRTMRCCRPRCRRLCAGSRR